MIRPSLLFSLLFASIYISAQAFITPIYFERATGERDTVLIGYDPAASNQVDAVFGEVDISGQPFDSTLDIRVAQLDYLQNLTKLSDFTTTDELPLFFYQSKVDIQVRECNTFNFSDNQGLFPNIGVLIPRRYLPVTVRWDTDAFQDSCVNRSFITDFFPTGWWDLSG